MFSSVIKTIYNPAKQVISGVASRALSGTGVPQFETLAVSVHKKHVYHVELNRPKKLNTFNHIMWQELKLCFSTLSDNPECRVIIISGQGKHFTGGIDLNSFVETGAKISDIDDVARKARLFSRLIKEYQDGISSLEECVKPVLTLVHNACVGAGVDLITAADIRYCTEEAWFQVKEVDIGMAADVGTLQRLPKVIGNTSVARELCYTARKLPAKEALELGLVSKVFPSKEEGLQHVLGVAEEIASKSPVAVQVTKKSLVYSQSRSNEDGLAHIRLINQAMLQSEDLTTAAVAQLSKGEKPEFENF